jgi:methylamine dehydrogenase accessory protein MauD
MTEALLVSNLVLWLIVLGLCAVVFALARQIGLLHERITPAGALMLGQGPKVGEAVAPIDVTTLDGQALRIGGPRPDGRSLLVFFLSPSCPVCKELLPVLRAVRRSEAGWLDVVLASDGGIDEQRRFVAAEDLGGFPYVVSAELGLKFQVARLPHAALIDGGGILRSRGLVNSREHLESLFEAQKLQVASVQEFMQRDRHVA